MQTVWQAQLFSAEYIGFTIGSVVVALLCVVIFLKYNMKYCLPVKICCIVVVAIIFCMNIMNFCFRLEEWNYANDHLMVVEGRVVDFNSGQNGAESFCIDDVEFSYPISSNLIGYDTPKRDKGSVISGNGQHVRLTYYNRDQVNIIVKIEAE